MGLLRVKKWESSGGVANDKEHLLKVRLKNSDLRKHLGLLVVPWRFAEDREATH
jgi:hypothetical protein